MQRWKWKNTEAERPRFQFIGKCGVTVGLENSKHFLSYSVSLIFLEITERIIRERIQHANQELQLTAGITQMEKK
jgi:hypothetical protein